jgi:hypothetical protein
MIKSFVLVGILLTAAIAAVGGIFWLRDYWATGKEGEFLQQWGPILCAMFNAGQISTMNYVYKVISRSLTRMENHRTESQYEANFIAKAFVFQFVNTYASCM